MSKLLFPSLSLYVSLHVDIVSCLLALGNRTEINNKLHLCHMECFWPLDLDFYLMNIQCLNLFQCELNNQPLNALTILVTTVFGMEQVIWFFIHWYLEPLLNTQPLFVRCQETDKRIMRTGADNPQGWVMINSRANMSGEWPNSTSKNATMCMMILSLL